MPNLVAISQVTTKINRGRNPPPQALSVSNHPGQIGLNYCTRISVWIYIQFEIRELPLIYQFKSNLINCFELENEKQNSLEDAHPQMR